MRSVSRRSPPRRFFFFKKSKVPLKGLFPPSKVPSAHGHTKKSQINNSHPVQIEPIIKGPPPWRQRVVCVLGANTSLHGPFSTLELPPFSTLSVWFPSISFFLFFISLIRRHILPLRPTPQKGILPIRYLLVFCGLLFEFPNYHSIREPYFSFRPKGLSVCFLWARISEASSWFTAISYGRNEKSP